jgi:hypothetical protein
MRAETKTVILHVLYVERKGDRNEKGMNLSYLPKAGHQNFHVQAWHLEFGLVDLCALVDLRF